MRKSIAGLMIGAFAVSSAVGAMAAVSVPLAPVETTQFGQLNNRAVLGLAAAQAPACTPDSNGEGCPAGSEEGGFLDGNALPVVAGVGAVVAGIVLASGGGGGSSDSPVRPVSP